MGGVPALKNFIPDFWSTYPKRIEAADAILIGKTNALCWASTLQPTTGSLARRAIPSTSPFIYEGPIARTVEDLALAMSVLSGHEPSDPFSNPQEIDFLSAAQATSLEGIRTGYTPDFGTSPLEGGVTAVTDAAVQAFADAGAELVALDLKLPFDHQTLTDMWCRLICAGSFGIIQGLKAGGIDLLKDHSEQVPETLKYWMDMASKQSLTEMQADQVMRTGVYDTFAHAFASVDLIVSPTTTALPILNREAGMTTGPSSINGVEINPLIGWCPTYLTNLIGHPAASVPAGLSGGLPVGLHIMGRRYADWMSCARRLASSGCARGPSIT